MSRLISDNLIKQIEGTSCLSEVCTQNPYIVIRTQCGIGRYMFQNISYKNDELVLEFKLIKDDEFGDNESIVHNIGKMCYLTASQYLYAFDYQAYA